MARKLSHYDSEGRARMVDVSAKALSKREAEASAMVVMKPALLKALPANPKGGEANSGVDPDVPSSSAFPH